MDLTFSAPAPGPDFSAPDGAPDDFAPARPPVRIHGRADGRGGALAADPRFAGAELVEYGAWSADLAESAGLVIVAVEDLSGREFADFLTARADEDGWVVAVPEADSDAFRVVSASHDYNAHEFSSIVAGAEDAPYVLDLRTVLKDVSVARHDLNNPLTSALAETQLSLMDEPGGELQESLETIQRQLRRMRDLLKMLSPIRARR